jgi:2-phospho-L-lactate guanylyltransferase (CobY/MobA/RfbA family)
MKIETHLAGLIRTRGTEAREMALHELGELKKDVLLLEKTLAGKGRQELSTAPLFDIVHGAQEVFRTVAIVIETESLLDAMAGEVEKAGQRDYLERHGARLLTKPEGWHWINTRGEMVFLGIEEETAKAADKLKRIKSRNVTAKAKKGQPEAGEPVSE